MVKQSTLEMFGLESWYKAHRKARKAKKEASFGKTKRAVELLSPLVGVKKDVKIAKQEINTIDDASLKTRKIGVDVTIRK